jgi:ribosomal protein S27E
MHLLDERQDSLIHARPMRCPYCRKFVRVLVFDSPAVGMICAGCHRRFTDLRKAAALVPRHLRAQEVITANPVRCAQCRDLALVFVDTDPTGLLCQHCHERVTLLWEAPIAGVTMLIACLRPESRPRKAVGTDIRNGCEANFRGGPAVRRER